MLRPTPLVLAACLTLPGAAVLRSQEVAPTAVATTNPYNLSPFYPDFPGELVYPNHTALEYDRTRRQAMNRIIAHLEGSGRREAWQAATEFFWNGPEEIAEPLIEAMDRAFGDPSRQDMVRNCVEAMGRMGSPAFEEALQRALEHKNPKVRQSALGAMASSSSESTLRGMYPLFTQMDGRSRTAWLRAARMRLGKDAAPMFRDLMMADFPVAVRDEILLEVLKMPAADAVVVLRGRWGEALGEFKAIIAGVLHAAGDVAGTTWLQDTLRGEDLAMLPLAVRHCCFGDLGVLRNHLLSLSGHPRAEIRFELAKVLMRVEGEDIASVYELLSQPDEAWQIKSLALRELRRRGRADVATALLEEVETASGVRLQTVLNMLGATADPRAVPVFRSRFEQAPPGEGRPFLQSLAVLGGEAAAEALLELFLADDKLVDRAGVTGRLTTLNYIPLLLMNVRGSEDLIIKAFAELPKDDWRRRAALMPTIIGMAADRNEPALTERCVQPIKQVLFDREQAPQLRVLALNLLTRRHLTLDDVMRLKNKRFDEKPPMRALFADFLNEYF